MRKVSASVFMALDFMICRANEFIEGNDLDVTEELPKLKALMEILVSVGVVDPTDWRLPGRTFKEKLASVDKLKGAVEVDILNRILIPNLVERVIVLTAVSRVSELVVEMAVAVLLNDLMVDGVQRLLADPPKRGFYKKGKPVDRSRIRTSASYLTPDAHLEVAKRALTDARAEVKRALERVNYQSKSGSELGDGGNTIAQMPVRFVSQHTQKARRSYLESKADLFTVGVGKAGG